MKRTILAIALALAALGPAMAGTRDDVVQGIVRCGTIADDRQWLDCVYGAAQPMRAQLGLPPAPAAQQRLVPAQGYGTLPGYGGTPGPAQAVAPPPAYAPQPGYAPQQAYGPPPPKKDRGFFGFILGEKDVPDITSRMKSYSFGRTGLFTVTLVNGQTWVQIDSEDKHPHWDRRADQYVVTISAGAFGTNNLTVLNEPGLFKVKRVR